MGGLVPFSTVQWTPALAISMISTILATCHNDLLKALVEEDIEKQEEQLLFLTLKKKHTPDFVPLCSVLDATCSLQMSWASLLLFLHFGCLCSNQAVSNVPQTSQLVFCHCMSVYR